LSTAVGLIVGLGGVYLYDDVWFKHHQATYAACNNGESCCVILTALPWGNSKVVIAYVRKWTIDWAFKGTIGAVLHVVKGIYLNNIS